MILGTWGTRPWDSDEAADWFADLFDATSAREFWLKGIQADPRDEPQVVRAAAWLFRQLGRVYVWPIADLDADRARTIAALQGMVAAESFRDAPELAAALRNDLAMLIGKSDDESKV
jgi:hypothetical protein